MADQMMSAEAWMNEQGKSGGVTTEELDKRARAYQDAYSLYENKKKEASALLVQAEELEASLISALELAGKQKYHVEGLGVFYFSDKLVVKTPKTNEEKKSLFKFIQKQKGLEFYIQQISINHQTLQSLYKAFFEEAVAKDPVKGATFQLPGVGAPTNMRGLSFRKETK